MDGGEGRDEGGKDGGEEDGESVGGDARAPAFFRARPRAFFAHAPAGSRFPPLPATSPRQFSSIDLSSRRC